MTRSDVPTVEAVLGRAFHDDPVWLHVLRGVEEPERRIGRIMATLIRGHLGKGHVWVDQDCSAVGAWAPPGRWRTPWWLYATHAAPLARAIGLGNLGHLRTLSLVEKLHPSEPHYYLSILGTDPRAQGKGLGSGLIRVTTDRADADDCGCYLESSKLSNVPFYERHGFRVTREIPIRGDGPIIYAMWREPRPPEAP